MRPPLLLLFCSLPLHCPLVRLLQVFLEFSYASRLPRAPLPLALRPPDPTVDLSHHGTYHDGLILHSLQTRHLHHDMRFFLR